MSQFDMPIIDPYTDTGITLAEDLNNWRNAIESSHIGATRPTYIRSGMFWVNNSSNPYGYYFFDGTDDILVGTVDTTSNKFLPANSETVVDSIVSLRLVNKTSVSYVLVTGYYAKGDGGGGNYYYDSSDTTSSDNGGTIIVGADGGRWKLIHNGTFTVKQFGAKGDGTTDDTSTIQAAIDSLGSTAGVVVVPNGARCLIDNNLTIKSNVTLKGPHAIVGTSNNNLSTPYGTLGGALLVNSTKTISVKGGATLQGLLIHRSGMTFPAPDSSAFAGTAITLTGDDAAVFQCMILGFGQAITSSGKQRPRLYDNNIDCSAGILIDNCADIGYITRNHCWPFATLASLGPITTLQRSGAAYKFTTLGDWSKLTDCFSYAYARGFWINNCNSMTLQGCAADSTGSFAGQIGFLVEGTSTDTRLVDCQTAAQETGYRIATSAGVQTRMIGCDSWACSGHGVLIDSGDVYVSGGIQRNTVNGITVNNATSTVFVDQVRTKAISNKPISATVGNTKIHIGRNNDFGDFAAGVSVTTNTYKLPATLVAADPLNLLPNDDFFTVTGNTNFGTIGGGWAGRQVVLKFEGTPTVLDGGATLKLNGNFVAQANATLCLVHDGTAWYETARSIN